MTEQREAAEGEPRAGARSAVRALSVLLAVAAVLVCGWLLFLFACSDEESDPSELAFRFEAPFVLRDSGGVAIAESGEPAWSEGDAWTLGHDPLFVIGTIEGSDAYLLQSVRSARRLPGGGVIFAEAGDETVRRFDSGGEWIWTAGGRGDGPGEFRCLGGILLQGRSVLAWQCNPTGAPVRYGLDGEVIEVLSTRSGARGSVLGSFSNGDLLILGRDGPPIEIDQRLLLVERAFIRAREDRSMDTLVVLPYEQEMVIPVVGESTTQVLSPSNIRTLHRDTLYTGFNKRYEIGVYDGDGRLHRIVRRAFEPEPLDRDSIRGLIDEALDQALDEFEDPTQRRAMRFVARAALRLVVYPDFMPAYSEIRRAKAGELWVRVDTNELIDFLDFEMPPAPGRWDVFDGSGRWLGRVVTPVGFSLHEIGHDYVLGVVTNELDVQFVVAYPLLKPGTS